MWPTIKDSSILGTALRRWEHSPHLLSFRQSPDKLGYHLRRHTAWDIFLEPGGSPLMIPCVIIPPNKDSTLYLDPNCTWCRLPSSSNPRIGLDTAEKEPHRVSKVSHREMKDEPRIGQTTVSACVNPMVIYFIVE